jgi:hypothetical protein
MIFQNDTLLRKVSTGRIVPYKMPTYMVGLLTVRDGARRADHEEKKIFGISCIKHGDE